MKEMGWRWEGGEGEGDERDGLEMGRGRGDGLEMGRGRGESEGKLERGEWRAGLVEEK